MRTIPKIAAIATLLATGPSTIAADGVAVRTGWYLGAGLGAGAVSRLEQKGWNRDSFCYPDATCFDEEPIPEVPGYRWRYDVDLVGGEVHTRSYGVLRPGGMLVWLIAAPFEDRSAGLDIEVRQAMILDNLEILASVVGLAEAGHLRPLVSRVLPLDRAAEAHRILEAGENTRGRLVLETQRFAA